MKFIYSLIISSFGFGMAVGSVQAQDYKVGPALQRLLDANFVESVPVIVVMDSIGVAPFHIWEENDRALTERYIKQRTYEAQRDIRAFVADLQSELNTDGLPVLQGYKPFWVANILMATITPELVFAFAERDDVRAVILDDKVQLWDEFDGVATYEEEGEYTYGLEKIRIPELREAHPGLTGKGIRVGILDTGFDPDHPEFQNGNRLAAFKDFIGKKTRAYDDNGHGTHCAGTIGGFREDAVKIGVAPEVQFIIGKILSSSGGGTFSGVLRGMEWVVNPDGNPDTADFPHIISNSWGAGMRRSIEEDPFHQVVLTWVQLNAFPSFAAGNSGPRKSSMGTPGGLPQSFGVGATDARDDIARFSSRGPTVLSVGGEKKEFMKPEISAPGVKVYSSLPGGKYAYFSGTSMATPHVSGALALALQAKPDLKVHDLWKLLMATSEDLGDEGQDIAFGAGRMDVVRSIDSLF